MTTVHCPRCHQPNHDVRWRSPLYWVALGATAVFFVGMVLASSLIGPFIMFAVPIMALVGFAFGPLHGLVTEEPSCRHCGRTLALPPTDRELDRRDEALVVARAA